MKQWTDNFEFSNIHNDSWRFVIFNGLEIGTITQIGKDKYKCIRDFGTTFKEDKYGNTIYPIKKTYNEAKAYFYTQFKYFVVRAYSSAKPPK